MTIYAQETEQPASRSFGRDETRLASTDWQERYESGKTGWDRGELNPMLHQWLKTGELRPCQILVPGCGRGHEVIALAEAEFDATAIDFANAATESMSDQLMSPVQCGNFFQHQHGIGPTLQHGWSIQRACTKSPVYFVERNPANET